MKVDLLEMCEEIGLDIGDLVSGNRRLGVALMKQSIYYRLRYGYGLSLNEIADLCHKDHKTIHAGIANYERLRDIINLTQALIE